MGPVPRGVSGSVEGGEEADEQSALFVEAPLHEPVVRLDEDDEDDVVDDDKHNGDEHDDGACLFGPVGRFTLK